MRTPTSPIAIARALMMNFPLSLRDKKAPSCAPGITPIMSPKAIVCNAAFS